MDVIGLVGKVSDTMKSKHTVSKRNRDIAMKIIIDFHENRESGHTIGPKYLTYHGLPKSVDPYHVIDVLKSMGYIDFKKDPIGKIYSIDLTEKGKHYFETNMDISREKKVEWIRYIITTLIALIALVKSFLPEISMLLGQLSQVS